MPLRLDDVVCWYGDRSVLDGVDLDVHDGATVGLVGANGAGKTTVLEIAAGVRRPDGGAVHAAGDVGYFGQDSGLDPRARIGDVLHDALAPLHAAVARLESLAARLEGSDPAIAQEYDDLLEWAGAHEAWDADRRAAAAADRLGVGRIEAGRRVADLSGGERARLALATLLTARPAVLLLDEPTNHLDDDALSFLEEQLRSSPGATLVASHDRVFLDGVCTAIVDLDPAHFGTDGRGGRLFTGNFSDYLAAKRHSRAKWQADFEAQREELRALRSAAGATTADVAHDRPSRDNDKFTYAFKGQRVQATATRRRRNAEQRIASIERDLIPKPPAPMHFSGSFDREPIASVELRDVLVPGRLRCPRLTVQRGGHLLITGANGAGKSTLLDVIAGRHHPVEGSVGVHARSVGLLTQDVQLTDLAATASEVYDATDPRIALSSLGLLHPRDQHRPLGELSLGQQRRVELAMLLAAQPDLLLLDEPTNHLSLSLVDELEQALVASPVTLVLASHDRWLRRRWAAESLELRPSAA